MIVTFLNNLNIIFEGSMDLHTNYRDSYIPHEPLPAQSAPLDRKDKPAEEKAFKRRPMFAVSQTSLDFRPYPNHRPSPPAEMEPFVSQISLGDSLAQTETLVEILLIKTKFRTCFLIIF